MDTIKVWFSDFWEKFNPENNYFVNLLRNDYNVIVTEKNPDFVFFSVFGNRYSRYNCVRIFYTGENIRPNFREADWAFTFDFIPNNERHYRLPFYGINPRLEELLHKKDVEKLLMDKKYFCAFIYSNPTAKMRNNFFKKLSKYKRVDSGGAVYNNLGFYVEDKINFLKKYKFTIAFENQEYPGYTTEKILDSMLAGSVPIYWGNPLVHLDFNTRSFLNYYDFGNYETLIEKIIELDNSEEKYSKYLSEPFFYGYRFNDYVNPENVLHQLRKIVTTHIEPVAWVYHKNSFTRRKYYLLSDVNRVVRFIQKKRQNFSLLWLKIRLKQKLLKLFFKKF